MSRTRRQSQRRDLSRCVLSHDDRIETTDYGAESGTQRASSRRGSSLTFGREESERSRAVKVFVPAHMFSDHDDRGHCSPLLGMPGQRWSSRSIVGGDAGLMAPSKRSGCESGWCSVADVFEVCSEPRQSMIWRRSVQRLRTRHHRREGVLSFGVFRRSCTPSVLRYRDCASGSSSEAARRLWSWVLRWLIEQVSTELCSRDRRTRRQSQRRDLSRRVRSKDSRNETTECES